MMTVSASDNPLSYPLVEHLLSTPSLVYAVQSVSAGQRNSFYQSAARQYLEQRGRAIKALQNELHEPTKIRLFRS